MKLSCSSRNPGVSKLPEADSGDEDDCGGTLRGERIAKKTKSVLNKIKEEPNDTGQVVHLLSRKYPLVVLTNNIPQNHLPVSYFLSNTDIFSEYALKYIKHL
ncbi:hypothetical protein D3C71_1970170 [compost metagenome]